MKKGLEDDEVVQTRNPWPIVRGGLIAVAVLNCAVRSVAGLEPSSPFGFTDPQLWAVVAFQLLIGPLITTALIRFARVAGLEAHAPSWQRNPFSEPLQFFHLSALAFITAGTTCVGLALLGFGSVESGIVYLGGGIGVLLGVKISVPKLLEDAA